MKVLTTNAPGDIYKSTPPAGYDSWLDYWARERGKTADRCRSCGATTDLVGGHVQRNKETVNDRKVPDGIAITPLCKKCNHPDNTESLLVEEFDLVHIPK